MIEIKLNSQCNYIHLLSGGLDSTYSILKLAKDLKHDKSHAAIQPIFFDYGHYAAKTEWIRVKEIVKWIHLFLNDKTIIKNPIKISLRSQLFQWCKSQAFRGLEGEEYAEIENRNLVLFSVLASYLIACANHQKILKTKFEITSGFKEKELPDCNNNFFEKFTEIINLYTKNRQVPKDLSFHFPVLEYIDRDIVIEETRKLLNNNQIELDKFLELTTSCYSPTNAGKPCYKCCKCKSIREGKIERNKINLRFSM